VVSDKPLGGRSFVAEFAVEALAEAGGAALFGQDPFAGCERWVVTDVLVMTAFEQRAPVAFMVGFKSDDAAEHKIFCHELREYH